MRLEAITLKRKILNLTMILVICGIIITSIIIYKDNKNKEIPTQSNQTTQLNSTENTITTPTPTENTPSPTETPSPTSEPEKGEILSEKKVDLDGDSLEEDIQIMKVANSSDNQEYEGVLNINGKDGVVRIPFLKRTEASLFGVFTSVEFVDLDGDGIKDVFITIPDGGAQFNMSYFFAYSYKKQKAYAYQPENTDLVISFIEGFKFNYAGKGILNMRNDAISFKADIDLKDNANFSDSENLNKATYNKTWISTTPIDLNEDSKLILIKNDENKELVKIPFPIFGQATADILGEIDTYFAFNNEFKPVMRSFEVMDYNGNEKNMVGSKTFK